MTSPLPTKRRLVALLLLLALLIISLAACDTLEIGIERTATPRPAPANTPARPTAAPATPVAAPTATARPSPPPSPTAPPTPTATSAGLDRVKVFLIALDDNGKAGKLIGCGDSAVAVERQIQPTHEPLRAALNELLSIRERTYGQSGLYNVLYQSDLKLDGVSLAGGKATINLSGVFMLGGACDNPRVEAQIKETALQFATVRDVAVFINGKALSELLSLK